jgi:NO-binding membrane sensor protein with MHYT domain
MIVVLMSFAIGDVAIWSMHFVGMSSLQLTYQYGNQVPICYRLDLTLISLVVAVVFCYIGIYVCSKDAAFTIDNLDTVDPYIEQASSLSMSKKNDIFLLALFTEMHKIFLGAMVTAAGVCIMH